MHYPVCERMVFLLLGNAFPAVMESLGRCYKKVFDPQENKKEKPFLTSPFLCSYLSILLIRRDARARTGDLCNVTAAL